MTFVCSIVILPLLLLFASIFVVVAAPHAESSFAFPSTAASASATTTTRGEDDDETESSPYLNLYADIDHSPFLHGVGSADPLTDRVLIWTRVTTDYYYHHFMDSPPSYDTGTEEGREVQVSGERRRRSEEEEGNRRPWRFKRRPDADRIGEDEADGDGEGGSVEVRWALWEAPSSNEKERKSCPTNADATTNCIVGEGGATEQGALGTSSSCPASNDNADDAASSPPSAESCAPSFNHPLRSGWMVTNSTLDYTVTIDVTGLTPGTSYRYQFAVDVLVGSDGAEDSKNGEEESSKGKQWAERRSMVGTTQTLSADRTTSYAAVPLAETGDDVKTEEASSLATTDTTTIALVSCTSLYSGYFNMYRHIARNADIDLVLHLGDYIYPDVDEDEVVRVPPFFHHFDGEEENGERRRRCMEEWDWLFYPKRHRQRQRQRERERERERMKQFEGESAPLKSKFEEVWDELFLRMSPSPIGIGGGDKGRGGKHDANASRKEKMDPYLRHLLRSLSCSSTSTPAANVAREETNDDTGGNTHGGANLDDGGNEERIDDDKLLEGYRFVHNLHMLDPDLRAARAAHPFIVTLDNHDVHHDTSSHLYDGSRRAALEWVPQRVNWTTTAAEEGMTATTTKEEEEKEECHNNAEDKEGEEEDENAPFPSTLSHFRIGPSNNILDVIVLDVYGHAGTRRPTQGLLGNDQHDWLHEVLTNSSSDNVQWRLIASSKTFMPFTFNRFSLAGTLFMCGMTSLIVVAWLVCAAVETAWYSVVKRRRLIRRNNGGKWKAGQINGKDESDSGGALRTTRACNLRRGRMVLWAWFILWIVAYAGFEALFNSSGRLFLLNAKNDTWEGQLGTMMRLFDQFDATETDRNNVWATGDMHFSYAADVVRFDPHGTDLLDYRPHHDDDSGENGVSVRWKRYGVELSAGSGTRGNVDEKLAEASSWFHPETLLSRLFAPVANYQLVTMNRHYRYFDGQEHGYGIVHVTPQRVEATFYQFPILSKTDELKVGKKLYLLPGDNKWREQP